MHRKANKYPLFLSSRMKGISGSSLDFDNINKGLYGAIEKHEKDLFEGREQLLRIKASSIKECVYSNVSIPEKWKNKITYHSEVMKIFSEDERLVAYLGKGSAEKGGPKQLAVTTTFFPKLRKTASDKSVTVLSEMNEERKGSGLKKAMSMKDIASSAINTTNALSQKEIQSLLESYRLAYPLKQKEDNYLNNTTVNLKSSVWPHINHITKKECFKTSIYSKLLPKKGKTTSKSLRPKREKTDLGLYLNFDYENFHKKKEVSNTMIKKELAKINNYGPFYSYCPSCNNKNVDFYEKMDPVLCLKLIKSIRLTKKRSEVIKPNN